MAKKHRGRIQAQGGNTEKSVSWFQDTPLSKEDGLTLLEDLEGQLTKKEKEERKKQLVDWRCWGDLLPAPLRFILQSICLLSD